MTDKKLTDNEIKKALECCIIQCSVCQQCPLLPIKDNRGKCYTNLKKQTLDLINRLQAENRAKDYFEKLVPKQKEIIDKQETEIERLKNQVICIGNECDAYKDILETSVTEAKAEAYKECIEKVKAHFKHRFYSVSELDNLLKEFET